MRDLLALLVSTASLALVSCVTPPNVPVCSPNIPEDYYALQAKFAKLCEEDLTCRPSLREWTRKWETWVPPSDSARCVYTVSGKEVDVSAKKKIEGKTWLEIGESAIAVPAKESWAKIKTTFQAMCHKAPATCEDGAGNWERTIQSVDNMLVKAPR